MDTSSNCDVFVDFQVGFFPAECVEMFGGDKIPQAVATKMPDNTKPGWLTRISYRFFCSLVWF